MSRYVHGSGRRFMVPVVCAVLMGAVGCGFDPTCPPGSPANDPNFLARAEVGDLAGVWRISYVGNLAIEGAFGWKVGPGDRFLSFDVEGLPRYEGLMSPGNESALWQWNLQTGAGAPSQVAEGRADRSLASVDAVGNTDGTLTFEYGYREPFQRRSDLGDTDVVVLYEGMRVSATGDTLTGLRRELRTFRNSQIPLPGTEEVVWRVSLRRVEATLSPDPVPLTIVGDALPRGGGSDPYAVGQVFDLIGTVDPSGGSSIEPERWVWVIYRSVLDENGTVLFREALGELEGQTATFTAEEVGTYTVRVWATDGLQWVSGTSVDLVVE
ncbi:MAG: hypothetical protein JXQ73_19820 [Phycisphaerae bacterium]|nr:hypothetical protein [Phycisphaerae bacterium]